MNQKDLLLWYIANLQKMQMLESENSNLRMQAIRSKRKFDMYVQMWIQRKKIFRSRWSVVESSTYWEVDVPKYTSAKFVNSFRVNRDTFKYLVQNLSHLAKEDTNWRSPISLEKRIAIALYSLGSSAENRTTASLFGVGRSTVGEITLEVCEEICHVFQKEYLNFYPPTQHDLMDVVKGFEVLGFPQCSGAIDGCHIGIRPPKNEAVDYFNFKGWYSMILFAAVDYRYRFTYINVGSPGKTHDSTIFECSGLKKQYLNNSIFETNKRNIEGADIRILLLGDSAFRLSKCVMKPFPSSTQLSESEKEFNYNLSKCRRVVENAFGHLKGRFRKLSKGLEVHVDNAPIIIKSCCILHNICNNRNVAINRNWLKELADFEKHSIKIQPNRVTTAGEQNRNAEGYQIRQALSKYFLSRRGNSNVSGEVDGMLDEDELNTVTVEFNPGENCSMSS